MVTNGAQNIPTGASGTILLGQGVGTAPAFSTSTYPSTNAINTLLYASSANVMSALATANNGLLVTSASGVPSILADGTTGQILTATTGSPPSWVAPASQFTPNSVLTFKDDFVHNNGAAITNYINSELLWYQGSGAGWFYSSNATSNIGWIANNAISVSSQTIFLVPGNGVNNTVVTGVGAITINWVIQTFHLSTGTNRYTFSCGLASSTSSFTDGMYFQYSDNINSGNWRGVCIKSSSATNANSSTAVGTASFVNLSIQVNAAGTSVSFFVNGSQIANSPISTNIPTVTLAPFLAVTQSAGTIASTSVLVDLYYMSINLTTPR